MQKVSINIVFNCINIVFICYSRVTTVADTQDQTPPLNLRRSFRLNVIRLDAFFPPPHAEDIEAKLHLLCPVCALACYVERMAPIRHLASWLCEYISQA